MVKLTETTNDQLQKRRGRPPKNVAVDGPAISNGGMHVVAQHEPLASFPQWAFEPSHSKTFTTTMIPQPSDPSEPASEPVKEPNAPLKIALIGTAPSSRMLAPYGDPSWKIWACSPGNMNALPRVDAWFEIHGSLLWPENKHYGEGYIAWLSQLKIPVYMQDQRYFPHAVPLPKDELVEEFGPYYFTSSFSWMMAMAMRTMRLENRTGEIALYGIDMASRDEYILQRPGAYHFFQEAKRRGIKMTAPNESDILQPPGLYGYSEVTPVGRKLLARRQEITDRLNQMRPQRDQLIQQITYLEGALEDNDYHNSIWGGVQNNKGLDFP